MDNTVIWDQTSTGGILVGLVLPVLISFFKRIVPVDNRPLNFTITLFTSVLGAVAALWIDGKFNAESFTFANIFSTLIQVFVISQAAYNYFWKPAGTTDRIEAQPKSE